MKKTIILVAVSLLFTLIWGYEPFFVDDPSISPCGEKVAFIYMNNVWEVPFNGGTARRLTASNDRISRPSYSPDGEWISFQSDRDGTSKLYRIPVQGGPAELLTNENIIFSDWYPDSSAILGTMHSPGEDGIYVKLELGKERPLEIVSLSGAFASVSNDGSKIVFDRRGLPYRPTYEGSVNGDLWLYDISSAEFTRLTETSLTERYPKFSRINPNRIYYVASDGLNFQLFYMDNFDYSTRRQLSFLREWSVRDISVSHNTDRIVFEFFKEIWCYEPTTGEVRKINIEIHEDNFVNPVVHQKYEGELTLFSVSKNQELLVFSHKYDLFAVPVNGGNVRQLTFGQRGIDSIVIMHDNETIYYTSSVKGIPKLYVMNIKTALQNYPLPVPETMISWSADKSIGSLWVDDEGELNMTYDLWTTNVVNDDDNSLKPTRGLFAKINKSGNIVTLFDDEFVRWFIPTSPEKSKMIYTTIDIRNWVYTLKILDIKTNTTQNIYTTNRYIGGFLFSEDETNLIFSYNNNLNIVSLVNEWEEKEDNWDSIIPANKPATDIKNPSVSGEWDINSENFTLRNRTLVSEAGWQSAVFTTKDSTLYYMSTAANNSVLKSIKFDGKQKEDVYNFRGNVRYFSPTDDNTAIYYVLNNKLHKLNIRSKKSEPVNFDYYYSYNTEVLNRDVFEHVWGKFGHGFYDPNMHGVDWDQVYETFEPIMTGIKDVSILERLIEEMIGRVNASHTGFTPRREGRRSDTTISYAGFVPDFRTRLPVGIRIKKIYFGSELHQKYGITANDIILEVNGQPIHSETAISPLFLNLVDRDISLRIQTSAGVVNAIVKGITGGAQRQLQYEDMVLNNIRKVSELTDGKIGYLHIQQMNQTALRKFEQDFLAINVNKDAMIIDVRGNGGGRISNELMDIISRDQRAFTYNRRFGTEPFPTPSNIYQKPIVVLIDEDSYSDAEIFGSLFRDMNIGQVIGMPTSGSVIGTSPLSLFDGSSMRMPMSGWFRMNMENMELVATTPTIQVPMLPSDIVNGNDPQILRAIEVLQN